MFNRISDFLFGQQSHAFSLLQDLAENMEKCAGEFIRLATASRHTDIEEIAARLGPIKTEVDSICQALQDDFDRNTFALAIDRDDFVDLIKVLEDVINQMEHNAAFAVTFGFIRLPEPMCRLVRITGDASTELVNSVSNLRAIARTGSFRETAVRITSLENEADGIFRQAIGALFSRSVEADELVSQHDMLQSLEYGVDRCKDAMNVIRRIVMKGGI